VDAGSQYLDVPVGNNGSSTQKRRNQYLGRLMGRSIRTPIKKRKLRACRPRSPYTSSNPRPVKITYMEGYGPEGKLKEPTDGHP
jgi:hypothetical protein